MNKMKYSFLLLFLFFAGETFAQQSETTLLRIDDKSITISDFEYAYQKDLSNNPQSKHSVDDFLQSYILLKTKVAEAESEGLAKDPAVSGEYKKYASETVRLFTTDSISSEDIAKKIHDRQKINIKTSFIFLPFASKKVMPADTLEVYKKIVDIRNQLLSSDDENLFVELAGQYPPRNTSGLIHLWQTATMAPASVDDAIYNTPQGAVSAPIRTNEGYFLIKVEDTRADRGERRIGKIIFAFPDQATENQKDSVRRLTMQAMTDIDNGIPFGSVAAHYSSDPKAKEDDGDLGWYSVKNGLTPVFDSIFFSIDPQSTTKYSEPLETDMGVLLFGLTGTVSPKTWEQLKPEYVELAQKARESEIQALQIERLSAIYPYKINEKTLTKIDAVANKYHASDSLFFKGIETLKSQLLLTVYDKKYSVADFYSFIISDPSSSKMLSTDIVQEKLDQFILNRLNYVNQEQIVINNLELRNRLAEYYDGLLMFAVMDKEVWIKAQLDTANLQQVFVANRNAYKWDNPKYKGYVIHIKDKETYEKALSLKPDGQLDGQFPQLLLKEFNISKSMPVYIEKGIWGKGENDFVDNDLYGSPINRVITDYPYFIVYGRLQQQPESFEDVRGLVEADYQELLEKNWLETIPTKHQIKINKEALEILKQKYD